MALGCTGLHQRLANFFCCPSCFRAGTSEELEEPMLQPPVQTLPSYWVPPKSSLFILSTDAAAQQKASARMLQVTDSSVGSWDIDAAHPDECHTSRPEANVSSRQHSSNHTGVCCGVDDAQGIELRPAKPNILLGQYHTERSGQFVSANPGQVLMQSDSNGMTHKPKMTQWHHGYSSYRRP